MQNGGNNEKKVARGVNNEVLSEGGGGEHTILRRGYHFWTEINTCLEVGLDVSFTVLWS